MSSMETSEGNLNLKRAFGDSDTAQKKPKLNHGEIKEEPELELDEKVPLGLDTGLASIKGIVKSLKNEEASQTMLLHTGDRLPDKCEITVKLKSCSTSGCQQFSLEHIN